MPKIEREDPRTKTLPIILGVEHTDQNLPGVIQHVFENLKPGKIGLETQTTLPSGIPPGLPRQYIQQATTDSGLKINNFFGRIADHATSAGVEVKWLETSYSHNLFEVGKIRRLSAAPRMRIKKYEAKQQLTPKEEKELRQLKDKPHRLFVKLLPHVIKDDSGYKLTRASFIRSQVMAHKIMQQQWQPGDVVIVGSLHAEEIRKILNEKYGRVAQVTHLNNFNQVDLSKGLAASRRHYEFIKKRKQKLPPVHAASRVLTVYGIPHTLIRKGKTIHVPVENPEKETSNVLRELFALNNDNSTKIASKEKTVIKTIKNKNGKTIAFQINFKK